MGGQEEGPGQATVLPAPWGWTNTTLPGGVGGEPSIVASSDGTLYVAAPATLEDGAFNLAWRSDDGRTWTFLGRVNEDHGSNDASIAVAPDGAVWLATFWSRPDASCFAVARSQDHGNTWQETSNACAHPLAGRPGIVTDRPWIAADAQGGHVLYSLQAGASIDWFIASSADNLAWTAERTPALGPVTLAGPLSARDGMRAFAWALGVPSDPTSSTPQDVQLYRWLGPEVATSEQGGEWQSRSIARETIESRYPQVALTAEGAVASWVTLRDGQTVVRLAEQADGEWGAPRDVEATGTNTWPWLASLGGHTLLVWEHTDAKAPGALAVPEDAQWSFQVLLDGVRLDVPVLSHRGPLCAAPGSCDRRAGEFFSAAVTVDGQVYIAWADDLGDGPAFALPLRIVRWGPIES